MSLGTLSAGEVLLRPGLPVGHNVQLQRPAWVQPLTRGRLATEVPGLLAAVFNLCGQSHRLCSQLALSAAGALPAPDPVALAEALRREAATEHLRRIALDWPRLLDPAHAQPAEGLVRQLATSPLLAPPTNPTVSGPATPLSAADWRAQCAWLEAHVLGMPPRTWWDAWRLNAADWLHHWTRHTPGWLPRLLARAAAAPTVWTLRPERALAVPGPGAASADRPPLTATAAHTGCWTRVADGPVHALDEWALLGARVADLVALCLDDGSPATGPRRLRWGTHTGAEVADGATSSALAWVEMARGLLVHRVVVGKTPDHSPDTTPHRVHHGEVHAPTDCNLHPHGEVAHALAACQGQGSLRTRQVHRLMAAFDPCVPFCLDDTMPPPAPQPTHNPDQEPHHA
jgi:hypothetical protein